MDPSGAIRGWLAVEARVLSPHVVVWGGPAVYVYWVEGERGQALIDSGYTVNASPLVAWVRQRRDPSRPLFHLLTHSHFDHLGATPALREAFPEMRVMAHARVRRVLGSSRAVALIQRLSEEAARSVGVQAPPFRPFEIDETIGEGDRVDLGGVEIRVLETPGHTRDSLSYWVEPDGVLIPGEAAGVPDVRGVVRPQFLASYRMYLESLLRLRRLAIRVLGLPHRSLVEGVEAVRAYMDASVRNTRDLGQWIRDRYRQHPDVEAVFQALQRHSIFGASTGQTREAFLLNLRAMVTAVVREMREEGAG